jgi:hypothetical protein
MGFVINQHLTLQISGKRIDVTGSWWIFRELNWALGGVVVSRGENGDGNSQSTELHFQKMNPFPIISDAT